MKTNLEAKCCSAVMSIALGCFSLGCEAQAGSTGRTHGPVNPSATANVGETGGTAGVSSGPGTTGVPVVRPPLMPGDCDPDPGRVTLRRLTSAQYDHTARDLLGDTSGPGKGFPKDDAFLADTLTVGPLLFEKYATAADQLISDAWAREAAGTQPEAQKLWVCAPNEGNPDCAGQIVGALARKAFRRPLTAAELAPYLMLLNRAEGTLAERTQAALASILISPNFVFRVELDADPLSLTPHGLSVHEYAARLSYLVWGSMPDASLFARADSGELASVEVMRSELVRMLADPKARVLTDEFAMRWLSLTEVGGLAKDALLFPEATPALFSAMQAESRQFLAAFFEGQAPISSLLTADFTFINQPLAQHYGLDTAGLGSDLQRVTVPAGPRRGLLGQGAVMSLTSPQNRTSAVKRGKWVASRLLCAEPPPPPDGAIPETQGAEAAKTERERLAIHRASGPTCTGCHTLIDPIGLGLENFDVIGRFRTEVNGAAIDASGQLPSGQTFNGPSELAALLSADPMFHGCVGDQLATFAFGRSLATSDECLHRSMASVIGSGATLAELLQVLVTSNAFSARRGEAQGAQL